MATSTAPNNPTRRRNWTAVVSVMLATVVLLPVASIVYLAIFPAENVFGFLWSTTLPRYLWNTVYLAVSVGALSAIVGGACAWVVTVYDFPAKRFFDWMLFAPLAIPAYVGAYAITDFLEFAGPVQTGLRSLFGWTSASDYAFFEIRSRGAAIVVLTSVLYPYAYLLTRAALREQSAAVYEVARTLGAGGHKLFWKIGFPLVRPALAVGGAIAMMEAVADFGVVDFFAVQTLTTGIFTAWLEQYNAGAAAQIALMAVVLVLILVTLERISRSGMRFHQSGRHSRPMSPQTLKGGQAALAIVVCTIPVGIGFVLPVGVMVAHTLSGPDVLADPSLLSATLRSLVLAGVVAVLTTGIAVYYVHNLRSHPKRWPRFLLPLTGIGYAMPGAVLALGVMIPLSRIDHALADSVLALTGFDPGLMLTGTAFAVVFACSVRFFAIPQGAADSAMGRIAPSLPMASRSLGKTPIETLRAITLPMVRPSMGTALLLVFVDTVKELPMTLFLRPFNFETLSTYVYERASLEKIAQAAPPSLLICGVGLISVFLIIRSNR